MTNAWDLPIYYLLLGLSLLIVNFKKNRPLAWVRPVSSILFPSLLLTGLTITPFLLNFESIVQKVVLVDFHSPVWMLFFLWGLPLVLTLTLPLLWPKLKKPSVRFLVALIVGSWLLILIPEIVRVKDIYHLKHQRANTMFKLTYQAFVVFNLLVGPIFARIIFKMKSRAETVLLSFVFFTLIAFCLIYPYFGFRSYYFASPSLPLTLDGARFLQSFYLDDYLAIAWLKQNLTTSPVILEAVGESYSDFGRVSAFTGLPTVIGWPVHEWLWRADQTTPYQRLQEVKQIYENTNDHEALRLLKKYQVEYIFWGQLEKQAYPYRDQSFFEKYGEPVFASHQTIVYKLNLPTL